jgi:hypothetical protein
MAKIAAGEVWREMKKAVGRWVRGEKAEVHGGEEDGMES